MTQAGKTEEPLADNLTPEARGLLYAMVNRTTTATYMVMAGLGWFVLIRNNFNFPLLGWVMTLASTCGLMCNLVVRIWNRGWPTGR
ncbi:MAG: hypothetical protein ACRD0P_28710 [Stackebrandtia sp.]